MIDFEFHPASIDRFADLVAFFAQHGNPNYCWCTRWRLKSADFQRMKSGERREKLQALVQNNIPVGVMAYDQSQVVGWCSVAPRETYPLLEGSTTLKRIDDVPVWSVVCFFVSPDVRGQHLSVRLLQSAVEYAFANGATIVEGYPVEPDKSYRFMGSPSTFAQAGFREAGIAKNGRSIVRRTAIE